MKKIVIIGGSAGGASCAARYRRLDEQAQIIILERGEYISYANCGLPYHVGGVIPKRESLLVMTPEMMEERFRIEVRTQNEALSIDRAKKVVRVKDLREGREYEQAYDALVLATGSDPLRPKIKGIETDKVRTLWTVPDAVRIRQEILDHQIREAVVVGGGFIGLETAENLNRAGVKTTIVEGAGQVMAPLDEEMARILAENIRANGVGLILEDPVDSFADRESGLDVALKSGRTVHADLAVLAIGTRPNTRIARDAGLEVSSRGFVLVDEGMRTCDPDIYAVGDIVQTEDIVWGEKTMDPLAGPANKEGRIAADNIAGYKDSYGGSQATSVAKVFDLTAAATGANEKALARHGKELGKDYERIYVIQNSHAGYYPGALPMTIKLLFAKDGSRIYGAQIVGMDGVDKRIDTIAEAIRLKASARDLKDLELAYAPPYSSAKDPVNMAGFVAENVLNGLVKFADYDLEREDPDAYLLDVREKAEVQAYGIRKAVNIPLGQLRDRLEELPKEKEIIVFCAIGVRAYNGYRILVNNGFKKVKVYPGGMRLYRSLHPEDHGRGSVPLRKAQPSAGEAQKEEPDVTVRLDCTGMQCPGPIMKVYEAAQSMRDGQILEVRASDPGFVQDIAAWCQRTGCELLETGKKGAEYTARLRKRTPAPVQVRDTPQGKTIIVFSDDLDKVLASFIIANGAASMGRRVTMFFTFWGLSVLRKPEKQSVSKTFVEKMFGRMLPRGTEKLKLSKMNMGGMGTAMMKKIMKEKNVQSLEELMESARKNGVKLVACTMSMDIMGIRKEELIDGIEYAGVGTYLGDAEESSVNLFI